MPSHATSTTLGGFALDAHHAMAWHDPNAKRPSGLQVAWRGMLLLAGFLLLSPVHAHPVPKSNHDRSIEVFFENGAAPDQIKVTVKYRLEVDETTVILEDMLPFRDVVDVTKFRGRPLDYYAEYARIYAPILAGNLLAKMNGKTITFTCISKLPTLVEDEDPKKKGEPLGHLRCVFVFQGIATVSEDKENDFKFREANFLLQEGKIDLSLKNKSDWRIVSKTEPDEKLKQLPVTEHKPGDDNRLREATAVLSLLPEQQPTPAKAVPDPAPQRPADDKHESGLLKLFFHTEYGLVMLFLLAAGFGAVHALTPGHGKTLVAAYLVGQRGTAWHAVVLGLVTTLTHTGVVLLIALGLWFLPESMSRDARVTVQKGLGLAMGLLVVSMGFWLLLTRLSGRADHIHIGGHLHHWDGHHHHHPSPPTPLPEGARGGKLTTPLPEGARGDAQVSAWGLIALGVSGGLVPCTDAIAMLVLAIGMNLFWLAFPLLLAFSAGLAGVLVLIGILVVRFRNFAGSHFGEGRFFRALPIVSALLVTALGFWLCYETIHGG
ncbi:MAG: hypothetical protein L0215_24260 [Gemmataceae bacterium]|nr:hypothetical protein [Gemmataceae bacterium]